VAIAPKKWASPCPQQIKVLRTSGLPRDEDAAARLAAVAKLKAPLMERRSWTIDELKELVPWGKQNTNTPSYVMLALVRASKFVLASTRTGVLDQS
jgi:hypothetical protein